MGALKKMKSGEAAGMDDIVAEMFKKGALT